MRAIRSFREVGENRCQGPEVEDRRRGQIRWVDSEKGRHQDQVAIRGDGEELGDALNESPDDGFEHCGTLTMRTNQNRKGAIRQGRRHGPGLTFGDCHESGGTFDRRFIEDANQADPARPAGSRGRRPRVGPPIREGFPSGTGTESPHHPVGISGAVSSIAGTNGWPDATSTSRNPSRVVSGQDSDRDRAPVDLGRGDVGARLQVGSGERMLHGRGGPQLEIQRSADQEDCRGPTPIRGSCQPIHLATV